MTGQGPGCFYQCPSRWTPHQPVLTNLGEGIGAFHLCFPIAQLCRAKTGQIGPQREAHCPVQSSEDTSLHSATAGKLQLLPSVWVSLPAWARWPLLWGILGNHIFSPASCKEFWESEYIYLRLWLLLASNGCGKVTSFGLGLYFSLVQEIVGK